MIDRVLTKFDLTRRQGTALGALVALAVFVYLVGLGINRWANAYYAAAAQAGSKSWSAFFFGAFDAAGSITVDKPPLSIWFMALSVRLFGLNSFAIMLPQALMGIATIVLVVFIVKRYFGFNAGLVAGATLLITPVAALMFRFNNPDALITLIMTLAIWAAAKLNDTDRFRWAGWLGVFIGLGFMAKTFQALLILPALFIVFILFGQPRLARRIVAVIIAAVGLLVSGGLWFAIVSTIPATARPYIGSSPKNSVIDLAFGYNGLQRLTGGSAAAAPVLEKARDTAGIGRLFGGDNGAAIGWFLPLALITCVIATIVFFAHRRTDRRFFITALLGLSTIITALTFSLMRGTYHAYYTVQLAPLLAMLVGIFYYLTTRSTTNQRLRFSLAGALLISGVYQGFIPILNHDGGNPLIFPIFALGILGALCLAIPHRLSEPYKKIIAFVVIIGISAGPLVYTLNTVSITHTGSDVKAGPLTTQTLPTQPTAIVPTPVPTTESGNAVDTQLAKLASLANLVDVPQVAPITTATLLQNANAYRYVAAAVGGQNAAAYQLATEKPVLLMGGFNGTDPYPTFNQFKALVRARQIHYFVLSTGGKGKDNESYRTTAWIIQHFSGQVIGNVKLYDLTQPIAQAVR